MRTLAAAWATPVWVQITIAGATLVSAVGAVWRFVVRPAARAIARTEDLAPVLYSIAEEFKPDHGRSLRDVIDGLKTTVDGIGERTDQLGVCAKATGERAKGIEDRLTAIEQRLGIEVT